MVQARAVFSSTFNAGDFGMGTSATDIACTAGKFTEVGSYQVGAAQVVAFGSGQIKDGVDSRRTCKFRLDSATGAITGKLRLAVADANLVNVRPVADDLLSNWTTGVLLGVQTPMASEDQYLKVLINPDSTTTVDFSDADNNIIVPVTIANL